MKALIVNEERQDCSGGNRMTWVKMTKSDIPEEEKRLTLNRGKTGDRSPMLGRYNVGIDKAGLIEAEYVTVYWDKAPTYNSIRNLCVAYCPRDVMTEKDFDVWWYWDTF